MHRAAGSRLSVAVLLVAVALAGGGPAVADQITWLTMDFPPFYIQQGKDQGQGIADVVVHLLQRQLPGYTHREQVAEATTIMNRLKAGDHVCSAAYIRTRDRERVLEYSLPDLILPPNGITVRRDAVPRFTGGAPGPVSLARLLANHDLRLAVVVGRSYGPTVDGLLEPTKESSYVYWRHGEDVYRGLFEMLRKGSVDYVLGYPYEALYLAREHGVADEVVTLPLVELPHYTLGHVVCPKTAWGRRVIADVNRALLVERPKPEYRQAIARWLDDSMQAEFRRQYETSFLAPPT